MILGSEDLGVPELQGGRGCSQTQMNCVRQFLYSSVQTDFLLTSPLLRNRMALVGAGERGLDLEEIKAAVHTCAVLRPHLLYYVIPQNSLGWRA